MLSHTYNHANVSSGNIDKLVKNANLEPEKYLKVPNMDIMHQNNQQNSKTNKELRTPPPPTTITHYSKYNITNSISHNDYGSTNTLRVPWKIVILGDAGVGKTSLVKQYLSGIFSDSYVPTVEDSYLHNVSSPDGLTQCIEILDTSGFYEFPAMRELNIRLSSACVLVFDINREESLNNLIEIHKIIDRIKGNNNLPIVLVGNKADNHVDKIMLSEKATKFASDIFKCPYFEASAKDNRNVEKLFTKIVELINQKIESQMRRESVNSSVSLRRNSAISFARRISINTAAPNKYDNNRRFSEPVVGITESLTEEQLHNLHRKKHKNCTIS